MPTHQRYNVCFTINDDVQITVSVFTTIDASHNDVERIAHHKLEYEGIAIDPRSVSIQPVYQFSQVYQFAQESPHAG